MSASKFSLNSACVLLCLTVLVTQSCVAQEWTKDPTTWWPDPSTGIMWAGKSFGTFDFDPKFQQVGYYRGFTWQQASDYCASLNLGGFSSWRLPTLDEVKGEIVTAKTTGPYPNTLGEDRAMRDMDNAVSQIPFDSPFFKGGVDTHVCDLCYRAQIIWTSTLYQGQSAWIVSFIRAPGNPFGTKPLIEQASAALCARTMEPDLLQIAKAAAVDHPVSDLQTLQTFVPLNKARLAYQAGNYQESIEQAQVALSLHADPATANWGIGISYGQLGQWDQAIANLQSALASDKDFAAAETALKWAKDGQKAAKKGKLPKEPNPTWN